MTKYDLEPKSAASVIRHNLASLRDAMERVRMGLSNKSSSESVPLIFGATVSECTTGGLLVVEARKRRPAHDAGIQPGDVVVAIDGEPVLKKTHLAAVLRRKQLGDRVSVLLVRQARQVVLPLFLSKDANYQSPCASPEPELRASESSHVLAPSPEPIQQPIQQVIPPIQPDDSDVASNSASETSSIADISMIASAFTVPIASSSPPPSPVVVVVSADQVITATGVSVPKLQLAAAGLSVAPNQTSTAARPMSVASVGLSVFAPKATTSATSSPTAVRHLHSAANSAAFANSAAGGSNATRIASAVAAAPKPLRTAQRVIAEAISNIMLTTDTMDEVSESQLEVSIVSLQQVSTLPQQQVSQQSQQQVSGASQQQVPTVSQQQVSGMSQQPVSQQPDDAASAEDVTVVVPSQPEL
eukprot:TRINITY_DN2073_c0_g2_i1.p1 TRINITY_DN2073_c0_g2~~TRINITY_DN2073_c0_g2_i1.p1  ORF type:complete len:415 (-),score=102.58 TRINITY_DN2073_c0_g2_i1:29-1273(-)